MVKKSEYKPKQNRLLPIIGLALGVAFALVAYVLIPTVRGFLIQQGVSFGTLSRLAVDVLVGGVVWVTLFGIAMFFVSMAIGTHHDDKMAREYQRRSVKRKKRQKFEEDMKRKRRQQMRSSSQDVARKRDR